MRRPLARHAFTALSLLSLLLCVAACVLWVRSYFVAEQVDFNNPELGGPYVKRSTSYRIALGGIRFQHWVEQYDRVTPDHVERVQQSVTSDFHSGDREEPFQYRRLEEPHILMAPEPERSFWNSIGFYNFFQRQDLSRAGAFERIQNNRIIVVPFWSVAALTAVLPVTLLVKSSVSRRRRRRRTTASLCPNCGYDLRASPGRCPECGAGEASLKSEV